MKTLSMFLLLVTGIAFANAGTLNIHNMWTSNNPDKPAPKMFLWLEYKENGTSKNIKLDGVEVPTEKYLELTKDNLALTWDVIEAGNLSFVVFNTKDGKPPLDKHGKEQKWSINDDSSLGGFIEFTQTYKKGTTEVDVIWADLSNVDGIGLLCGLSGLPANEGGKAGYNAMQTSFTDALITKFSTLPTSAQHKITIKDKSYTKIVAPGKSPANVKDPWNTVLGPYYKNIVDKDRKITLTIPNYDNGNWTGEQFSNSNYKTFPDIGINEPVAVHISSAFSENKDDHTKPKYNYDAYIVASKWNEDTINNADATHAVYIRTNNPNLPDFGNVPHDNKKDPNPFGTKWTGKDPDGKPLYGYDSMHINLAVSTDSTQPFPISPLAFAVSRVCAVIQDGYINPDNNDPIVFPVVTTGKKYGGNLYNDWILANSNSYGQPYSDGQAQVLYHPPNSFDLYILAPDAPNTGSYYVKGGGIDPNAAKYILAIGGGAQCTVDKISISGQDITGDNGAFQIPGELFNPDQWVQVNFHFKKPSSKQCFMKLKLKKNPNDYGTTPPTVNDSVEPSTGFSWSSTGNKDMPFNLASGPINPDSWHNPQ